jgi:hypothetical protein
MGNEYNYSEKVNKILNGLRGMSFTPQEYEDIRNFVYNRMGYEEIQNNVIAFTPDSTTPK